MAVSETLGLEVVITGVSKVVSELSKVDSAAGALALGLKGVGKIGSSALKLLTTPLRAIGKVASLAWSGLSAVARSILRIGEYVVGNLIARAVTAIGTAIWNMAGAAVQAAADMQMMQVSIEGLLARELSRGDLVTETSTSIRHATEAERLELDKLTLSYGELGVELADAEAEYAALATTEGETTDEELAASIAVRELRLEYQQMGTEIQNLQGIEGSLITTQTESRINTMDMADALNLLAGEEENRAEAMTKQLLMMALISPFQIAQTNETFRLAMAYGMGSEQAMEFTKAALDTAAGLGMSNVAMERFVYNLAQAVVGGDLTGINLRQLSLTSFNLAQVLRDELGMSIEEVRDALKSGQLTLEEVSDAFVHHADVVWAGAAERARNTWTGFKNSLEDLNNVMGALVIEPALSAISQAAVPLFDAFTGVVEGGVFERMGESVAGFVEEALGMIPVEEVVSGMPWALEVVAAVLEGRWNDAWNAGLLAVNRVFGQDAMQQMNTYKVAYIAALNLIKALLEGSWTAAWENTKTLITEVFGEETREPLEKFETAVIAIYDALVKAEEIVSSLLSGETTLADFVSQDMVDLGEAFGDVLTAISNWFTEFGPDVLDQAARIFDEFIEDSGLAEANVGGITEALTALAEYIDEEGPDIRDTIVEVMEKIGTSSSMAVLGIGGIIKSLDWLVLTIGLTAKFAQQTADGDWKGAWETMQTLADNNILMMIGEMAELTGEMETVGLEAPKLQQRFNSSTGKMEDAVVAAYPHMGLIIADEMQGMVETTDTDTEEMRRLWEKLSKDLVGKSIIPDMMTEIVDAVAQGLTDAVAKMGEFVSEFYQKGVDLVQGLIDGIMSKIQAVAEAAAAIVRAAVGGAEAEGGFGSPSTVMFELGSDFVQGLIDGVESRAEDFAEVVEGLFDVAGTLSGIGGFFSGLYEEQRLDPLRDELEAIEDDLEEGARNRRDLEELITAERTQQIEDTADIQLQAIKDNRIAEEEAIKAARDAEEERLKDEHELSLEFTADLFDLREEEIERLANLEEDARKAHFSEEADRIKREFDDEVALFNEGIRDEERAVNSQEKLDRQVIKDRYDEEAALFNDQIDAEKRAIRDREDLEAEEIQAMLDAVDARKREDIRGINALERAELQALADAELASLNEIERRQRDGITGIGDRESDAQDENTRLRKEDLDDLQALETARIEALAVQEQAVIAETITGYEARLAEAGSVEEAALRRLIASSEAEAAQVEQRMEDEITALDIRIEKGWQALMGEERRLELLKQIEEEEARILALKEKQEQLKLLEQQQKLLDLIAEYELDASSILEGLTLGIDADAGMVLDAMTGAMDQIIRALQERLEIASPSGVFQEIGQEMMGGLAMGIAELTPALAAQINAAVSPVMTGGGGTVNNNYFNQPTSNYNLTTQSITRPGALELEFDGMGMASR